MCGICGVVSKGLLDGKQLDSVESMCLLLQHRGPDGTGKFKDAHVAMAMRRLSIIDLTGGWQPLFNEDRSLVLMANAEIYNFVELRAQLEARGHRFRTRSDCEVILHLYEDFNLDCVHHLRGMFAFALWDAVRNRLILARDRMGEKPLYLYENNGGFYFSSELKALLHAGVVPFELDPPAVNLYFHYQYVPEPITPIVGVRKLPAAHILTLNLEPWQMEESCYWEMEDVKSIDGDPAQMIRDELESISEQVIRADVPVGMALSGGVDSSALAALIARKYPKVLHAFCVGYPGYPSNDERSYAKAFAGYLGIPFHDVELDTNELVAFFPELVYWSDDPIADISGYGYYSVMKLARVHQVPVVFQGQGGDELFWGYPWVTRAVEESFQKADPRHKGWNALSSLLHFERPHNLGLKEMRHGATSAVGLIHRWGRFKRHKDTPEEQMVFYDLDPDFLLAQRSLYSFYTPNFVKQLDGACPSSLFSFTQPWPRVDIRITRLICETFLRENGVTQGDRLSMASSVELRLPLLDHKLVELVIGLRKSQRDYNLPPKSWFKAAIKDIVPEWVMKRPKHGFTPPVREWHAALFAAYGDSLRDGYLTQSGILKQEGGSHLAKGRFPRGIVTPISFKALVLEQWCRQMTGYSAIGSVVV